MMGILIPDTLWRPAAHVPFQTLTTMASIPTGVCAIVYGSRVSAAMSRVLATQFDVVRLWGGFMLAGGICATYGWLSHRLGLERVGLRLLGPAYLLYAVAVLLGLGLGGLVAGPMFAALALACWVRSHASEREDALEKVLRGSVPIGAEGGAETPGPADRGELEPGDG